MQVHTKFSCLSLGFVGWDGDRDKDGNTSRILPGNIETQRTVSPEYHIQIYTWCLGAFAASAFLATGNTISRPRSAMESAPYSARIPRHEVALPLSFIYCSFHSY